MKPKTIKILSMMIFYHNIDYIYYKVIRAVVYTFLDQFVYLGYLGIVKNSYFFLTTQLLKQNSIICQD